MAGVQSRQQVAHFRASTFTYHEPVGPHPQCFPHQPVHTYRSGSFKIRLPRFERHEVRVLDPQLGYILDGDDSFSGWCGREKGSQQSRLAGARCPSDQEVGS